jgi:3-deoxy-D-manno-octulosonic-acid transferase
MNLYSLSDLAFVGGSMVPVGGHNLLEPASRGIPLVFGSYMSNFKEIAALVEENKAGIQVSTPAELVLTLRRLIGEPLERRLLGDNGIVMMRDNGGSTEKHMKCIAGLSGLINGNRDIETPGASI